MSSPQKECCEMNDYPMLYASVVPETSRRIWIRREKTLFKIVPGIRPSATLGPLASRPLLLQSASVGASFETASVGALQTLSTLHICAQLNFLYHESFASISAYENNRIFKT